MAGDSRPILITFAIPYESVDLRRDRVEAHWRVVHTGIGLEAAAATLDSALRLHQPKLVVSAGFAGGLDPTLAVGDLVVDSGHSDSKLIEGLPVTVRRGRFLSSSRPLETPADKAAAFRDTGAIAVDMETEAIAAACRRAGIPALFLRVISDAAGDKLPLAFPITYDLARQRPRPFSVCIALLRSPSKIPRFARFVRDLRCTRSVLTRALTEFLALHSPVP